MKLFKQVKPLNAYLLSLKEADKSIGFVPTMGALHDGHVELIRKAKEQNDICVVCIFVNPTQFNENEDLIKYPRPLEQDIEKLLEVNSDILFLPKVEEVYPEGLEVNTDFGLDKFNSTMEGASRPGHFDGVAQVVKRFLDIVRPNVIYMGQKDFQQSRIVQKLVTDFGLSTRVEVCSTVRENDGLALSSRNVRLNKEERTAASNIPKVLFAAGERVGKVPVATIISESIIKLNEHSLINVEYFEIVNAATLEEMEDWGGECGSGYMCGSTNRTD